MNVEFPVNMLPDCRHFGEAIFEAIFPEESGAGRIGERRARDVAVTMRKPHISKGDNIERGTIRSP